MSRSAHNLRFIDAADRLGLYLGKKIIIKGNRTPPPTKTTPPYSVFLEVLMKYFQNLGNSIILGSKLEETNCFRTHFGIVKKKLQKSPIPTLPSLFQTVVRIMGNTSCDVGMKFP